MTLPESSRTGGPATKDRERVGRVIVCATAYEGGNPYAEMLYDEVARLGYEVWRRRLVEVLFAHPPRDARLVVHLHWISHLVRDPSRLRAVWVTLKYVSLLTALRIRGARLVWTFHNDMAHEGRHRWLERVAQWWLVHVLVDRIILMSEGARVLLADRFSDGVVDRIRVVPHPTYETAYGPQRPKSEARERLDLDADARVLLFFGRVLPYKGVPELLEAFSAVSDSHARLVVAGECVDSELRQELLRGAAGDRRVILRLERIPDARVPLWFSAADWVVLPYRDVLNSGVLLLALTYRRPAIAPAIGAIPEVLYREESLAGLLYDQSQPGALASALRRALEISPQQRERYERVLEEVSADLSVERIGKLLAGIYDELR